MMIWNDVSTFNRTVLINDLPPLEYKEDEEEEEEDEDKHINW